MIFDTCISNETQHLHFQHTLQWNRLLCLSWLQVSFDPGYFYSSKSDSIAGSGDIDTQIALKFASQYPIAFLHDAQHDLDQTVKLVQDTGGEIVLFETDFSANEHLSSSIAAVTKHFGKRCAAAIFQLRNEPSARPFLELTGVDDIRKGAVLPIAAAYAFARQTVPLLLNHADGSGHPPTLILAGTSGTSYSDEINDNALVALSRGLGREFGKKGIHVCHVKYNKGLQASSSGPNPQYVSYLQRSSAYTLRSYLSLLRLIYRLPRHFGICIRNLCLVLITKSLSNPAHLHNFVYN